MSIEYDDDDRTLRVDGSTLMLTEREGSVLRYMLDRVGTVVSRQQLERDVWRFQSTVKSEAVPVMMRRLRKKIGRLETIRGRGWRLPEEMGEEPWSEPAVLPSFFDRFVGREENLEAIRRGFDAGCSLLSLLGTGGAGKTRLAVEHATLHASLPVVFCEMTPATTTVQAASVFATALGATLSGKPVGSIGAILASRGPTLYVLDNLEQWPDAGLTLAAWVASAPHARFLVTTRERLGIRAESVVEVGPMPLDEAGTLFRIRAAQLAPALDLGSSEILVELLTLLDCLPLAIELAAGRTSLMSPAQLLPRLTDRFRLLVDHRRSSARTLDECVAWSWGLLEAGESSALAQLSVFAGPFGLEDAEAIVDVEEEWTVDLLQSLVDKSLLRRAPGDRFQLLVTIRAYAARELHHNGNSAAANLRHARWFARFGGVNAVAKFMSTGSRILIEPLDRVRAELTEACERLAQLPPLLAGQLARSAWMLFRHTGPFSVAAVHLETVMAHPLPDKESLCTGITLLEARRTVGMGDDPEWVEASLLPLVSKVNDRVLTAMLHYQWGRSLTRRRRYDEAEKCFDLALDHDGVGKSSSAAGAVLVQLAHVDRGRADLSSARHRLESALPLLEHSTHRRAYCDALVLAGTLTLEDASVPHRPEMLWKALEIAREERLVERELFTLIALARQSITQGADAVSTLDQAARELAQLGCLEAACKATSYLGVALVGVGAVEEGQRELEKALRYGGFEGDFGLTMALCNLAFFHLEYGDLEECGRFARRGIELARPHRSKEWLYARSTLALACIRMERLTEAREVLPTSDEISTVHPQAQRTIPWTAWVQLLLAEGRLPEAEKVARHIEDSLRPIARLARCRLLDALGDVEGARALAEDLQTESEFMRDTRSGRAAKALTARLIETGALE